MIAQKAKAICVGFTQVFVQFQNISFSPSPTGGIKISWHMGGGGGSQRPIHVKNCIKVSWNFQRGGGGLLVGEV